MIVQFGDTSICCTTFPHKTSTLITYPPPFPEECGRMAGNMNYIRLYSSGTLQYIAIDALQNLNPHLWTNVELHQQQQTPRS